MSRETAPYLLTPIGAARPPMHVLGPKLGPSYSELRAEVERLQAQVDNENRLRMVAQDRLSKASRVLAVLSHLYPKLRPVIERAREDIWDIGEAV